LFDRCAEQSLAPALPASRRRLPRLAACARLALQAGLMSADWRERWRDPILTALLVLLSLQVFVGEPLARAPFPEAPVFAVAWLLLVIAAVLVAARHWIAVAAILLSSALALIANILRIYDPSKLTICVGSGSLVVFMAALSWVAFAALYEILLTLIPNSITGRRASRELSGVGTRPRLLQSHHSHLHRIWRHHSHASVGTKPVQSGGRDGPAVSGNAADQNRDAADAGAPQ
jgi:hypothetical protein